MEQTRPHLNIAIDGPAGVGKTTIGLALAKNLKACFIDTGIMYRAIAYLTMQHNVPIEEKHKIARLASATIFTLAPDENGTESTLLVNGSQLTGILHTEEVNNIVSQIAVIPEVRDPLVAWQRGIANDRSTVMVGRDITTVVLPQAVIKIYLDASLEERNRRRSLQNDSTASVTGNTTTLQARDEIDSTRTTSPLYVGADVMRIDTTNLTFDEVYDIILNAVNALNL